MTLPRTISSAGANIYSIDIDINSIRIREFVGDRDDGNSNDHGWVGKAFGGEQDNPIDLARQPSIDQFVQIVGIVTGKAHLAAIPQRPCLLFQTRDDLQSFRGSVILPRLRLCCEIKLCASVFDL